ncbi:acyl-CoA-binding protein [Ohtaekwangia kribbensis]|jgi:diazepam-binding inhibitor (GABA receptor modulating acyl-CoA-binding protein)|uniref:Acyl-CoA-binding protein n=1 Tax=Ohtaekwangia kribbensis TaxID=688913 RepID=A0ABW3K6W7_9BACT
MELQQQFESAVARSKELTRRPTNEELLLLYALFKQATEGDVSGERPGGFDFKAIAKYDAWEELKGKSKELAMQDYIQLVEKLHQQYA